MITSTKSVEVETLTKPFGYQPSGIRTIIAVIPPNEAGAATSNWNRGWIEGFALERAAEAYPTIDLMLVPSQSGDGESEFCAPDA
jgi:hypothetical protein